MPQIEQRILADQLRRASKSILCQLRRLVAKQGLSKAEFRRFVLMSIGSSRRDARVACGIVFDLEYLIMQVAAAMAR